MRILYTPPPLPIQLVGPSVLMLCVDNTISLIIILVCHMKRAAHRNSTSVHILLKYVLNFIPLGMLTEKEIHFICMYVVCVMCINNTKCVETYEPICHDRIVHLNCLKIKGEKIGHKKQHITTFSINGLE